MLFTLNGMGLAFTGHEEYNEEIFAANPSIVWKMCSWHNNNREYQVGGKLTSVDVELYDMCRRFGAIVATGHEHSYARTHLMSSYADNDFVSTNNTLNLEPGLNFAFCHGLGGRSIREYTGNLPNNPWWAATAAQDDGVEHGPLICTLNINGDIRRGECKFIDLNGRQWDSFSIYNMVGSEGKTAVPAKKTCRPAAEEIQLSVPCTHSAEAVAATSFSPLTLRFPLRVRTGEIIDSASLEFLGLDVDFGGRNTSAADVVATISVYGSAGENADIAAGCDHRFVFQPSSSSVMIGQVMWHYGDTEWDEPIWKSPELNAILQKATATGANSAIIVVEPASDDVLLRIADDIPCHMPTLQIFIKERCFL